MLTPGDEKTASVRGSTQYQGPKGKHAGIFEEEQGGQTQEGEV